MAACARAASVVARGMTTILLALLACAQPSPEAEQAPILPPTVVECDPGSATTVAGQGAVWSVSVRLPSGNVKAPMVQMLSDSLIVYCPEAGGTLTVEWAP